MKRCSDHAQSQTTTLSNTNREHKKLGRESWGVWNIDLYEHEAILETIFDTPHPDPIAESFFRTILRALARKRKGQPQTACVMCGVASHVLSQSPTTFVGAPQRQLWQR